MIKRMFIVDGILYAPLHFQNNLTLFEQYILSNNKFLILIRFFKNYSQ